jgi:hypothetical protein
MNELIRSNSVHRVIVLALVMLVAVMTLACSCQLGNLIKSATEVAPTRTLVVETMTPKLTQPPAPTETPTPVQAMGGMVPHTNEEAGFRIRYPAEWFADSDSESSYFAEAEESLDMMDPAEGAVFAVFVGSLEEIEAEVGTIESVEQLMDALVSEEGFIPEGGELGEYEALRPDVMVVPAHWVDEDTEQPWHVRLGVVLSGERAGVMAGMTAAQEWEFYLDTFRAMAGSVELFEPGE